MPKTIEEIYSSLLADCHALWAAGIETAAYHALAGALHCAEELNDESRVKQVRIEAERFRTSLDRERPGHRLATASAADRGQLSLFVTLAGQADAIIARLHGTRAIDHARSKRLRNGWPGHERRLP